MKYKNSKFNWSTFGEGVSWAVFALVCLSGTGLGIVTVPNNNTENVYVGGFMIALGMILFAMLLYHAYDWAWENKE